MLRGFGIHEGPIQWGHDNRKFTADKANHAIDPSLLSIKGLSQGCANDLYKLYQTGKYNDFYSLWKEMSHTRSLNSAKIETLVLLDYFSPFAGGNKILKFIDACNQLYGRTQFPKDADSPYIEYIKKYSETTDKLKTYKNFDCDAALQEIWNDMPDEKLRVTRASTKTRTSPSISFAPAKPSLIRSVRLLWKTIPSSQAKSSKSWILKPRANGARTARLGYKVQLTSMNFFPDTPM